MPEESRRKEWLNDARRDLRKVLAVFDREGELLAAARLADLLALIEDRCGED